MMATGQFLLDRRVVDLRSKPVTVRPYSVPVEWSQILYGNYIRVYAGPVMWNNVQVDDGAATEYDVDWTALTIDENRWLYAEIDLSKAGESDGVVVAFTADDVRPADAPNDHIIRQPLSRWMRKSDYLIYKTAQAWIGNALHFTQVSFGPPMA